MLLSPIRQLPYPFDYFTSLMEAYSHFVLALPLQSSARTLEICLCETTTLLPFDYSRTTIPRLSFERNSMDAFDDCTDALQQILGYPLMIPQMSCGLPTQQMFGFCKVIVYRLESGVTWHRCTQEYMYIPVWVLMHEYSVSANIDTIYVQACIWRNVIVKRHLSSSPKVYVVCRC